MLRGHLSQGRRHMVRGGERGEGFGVGAGQEGFVREVSFHQKLREMRERALQMTGRRALQEEKQKMQRSWKGNVLGTLEKHLSWLGGLEQSEGRSVSGVVITQRTKLFSFGGEVRTGSTHRDKRASGLCGDLCINSVHPHNTINKGSEGQERERNCPRSHSQGDRT